MKTLPVLRGRSKVAPFHTLWGDKAYFAGGYVRYMVSPVTKPYPAGDIDIYPHTTEAMGEILKDIQTFFGPFRPLLLKKLHELEVKTSGPTSFKVIAESPVAYNVKIDDDTKIQVIKPQNVGAMATTGKLEDILKNFDFTVCKAGLLDINSAMVDDNFVRDELTNSLAITNVHCPIGQMKRIAKYVKKGYHISPDETFKVLLDWDSRSADYKARMHELMNKLYEFGGNIFEMDSDEQEELAVLLYQD